MEEPPGPEQVVEVTQKAEDPEEEAPEEDQEMEVAENVD